MGAWREKALSLRSWTQNILSPVPVKLTWALKNHLSKGTEPDGDREVDPLLLKLFSSSIIWFSFPLHNEDQIISRILVCWKEREIIGTYHFTEDNASNFWMNLEAKPSNYLDQQSPVLWRWTARPDFRKGQSILLYSIQSLGAEIIGFHCPAHSIKSQRFPKIPTCYHEKKKIKSLCSEKCQFSTSSH